MNTVIWKSSDNSLEIKLEFIVGRRLKYTHLGKGYPKHTQCLMYRNGILDCFHTIVKHQKDKDNPPLAYRKVAEMCLSSIENKWIRSQVRIILKKELSKV